MSFDEQPAEGSKWDIHYHDHSTEHKVRVIAHCKHCARCRFERKNADCVVLAVAPVADDQPDGDIHGECAAESEPSELSAFEKWWAMLSKVPYMSKKEIADRAFYAGEMASYELRFDACRPYLKEGETAADALKRLSERRTVRSLCEAYEAFVMR